LINVLWTPIYNAMTKSKIVTIKLFYECECGHKEELTWATSGVRYTPAYTNESGTSWSAELEITCQGCKGHADNAGPF
jgi:hypothetical protein